MVRISNYATANSCGKTIGYYLTYEEAFQNASEGIKPRLIFEYNESAGDYLFLCSINKGVRKDAIAKITRKELNNQFTIIDLILKKNY